MPTSHDTAPASIVAAADAIVAKTEAAFAKEQSDAASARAADAWAAVPTDPDNPATAGPAEATAWAASEHASALGTERSRAARRSLKAATLAAQTLAAGMPAGEFAASEVMGEDIDEIVAATKAVKDDAAHPRAAKAELLRAANAIDAAADGND